MTPSRSEQGPALGDSVLIDTSDWIFALSRRGQEAIRRRVDALLDADAAITCGLVELELLGGTGRPEEAERLAQRLGGVRRVDTIEQDWRDAAAISSALRRVGRTVPPTDALLAAISLRTGAVLLHADNDFEVIAAQVTSLRTESLVALVGTA